MSQNSTTNNKRTPVENQLSDWYKEKGKNEEYSTNAAGIALVNKDASVTIGERGYIVLRDWNLVQQLGHFGRERIPERVVHAKGAGAFGYFEVTHDISHLTISKVFEKVGKKTPIAVRFSQVAGNLGASDTVRDPRGFAVKFYTEEGIWDLVGNNTPIFFMRDPILFPMFIHSQKRNPVTNVRDWDMFWDYLSLRQESVHQVMFLFSDRGLPDGHRHMHGFGSHTFSLINANQEVTYCKFVYKTNQGIKNLDPDQADILAGKEPDYALKDLYNAIASGNPPSWTFFIQTMTPEQAKSSPFDPFDITKVWPHAQYPLHEVGKLVLNRNPANYFAEVEQLAFNPNNLTPGIGDSPDRLLQGRLFSYQDTHRYRLGVNFEQLPVNCPFRERNFQRDGEGALNNQGGAPNYHPNSFGGPDVNPNAIKWWQPPEYTEGEMKQYDTGKGTGCGTADNYTQPRVFYNKVLDEAAKQRLVKNLAGTIKLANAKIRERCVEMFEKVDSNLGNRLRTALRNAQEH